MARTTSKTETEAKKTSSGYTANVELHYGDDLDSGVIAPGAAVPAGAFSEEDLEDLAERGHVTKGKKNKSAAADDSE